MQNPRSETALILQLILEEKIFFGELKKQVSEKDLPFVNMLVLTVLRKWAGLNTLLSAYLSKKIPHKHRMAQYLLLAACAELLFMETKPYAVINETVKNVRKATDSFLAGMTNAVLRKISQNRSDAIKTVENANDFPQDFRSLLSGYSDEEIQSLKSGLNNIPPLDITVKANPEFWAEKLHANLLPNGTLRLFNAPKVPLLYGYDKGEWWIQDAAAALPVQVMGDIKGLSVIDLCAAPGGKTAQLAATGANVTALDISQERLKILKQNMDRLGFNNIKTICASALDYMREATEKFDAVLLDAPCSATGTFRRHPEVMHIKTVDDVRTQCTLQRELLENCANILKPDGILVYSVCSVCKDEGENQIRDFLQNNTNFRLCPIKTEDTEKYGVRQKSLILPDGTIRTLPSEDRLKNDMDSFFICKMKRII